MCCRSSVDLLDLTQEEIALVLRVAGFQAQSDVYYRRDLGQGRHITASISPDTDGLVGVAFALAPTIGGHSRHEHHVAAPGAAILFHTAQVLGERGNGRMRQLSLLGACLAESHNQTRELAHYPAVPLLFGAMCLGFRSEFELGIRQLTEEEEVE